MSSQVSKLPTFDSDFVLAESCLEGNNAAVNELRAILSDRVARFLVKRGADAREIEQFTSDLLHDLIVGPNGRPPLLRRFTGQCAIPTWLIAVATNRWFDRHRDGQKGELFAVRETDSVEPAPILNSDEAPLVIILRQAIQDALTKCVPEDFVLFQLLHAEGLHQTELARMFGCDRRSVARNSDRIAAELRVAIMQYLDTHAPDLRLEWEDVVQLCRAAPVDVVPLD